MNTLNLSLEKKVDIIFSYLFDDKLAEKEESFWNELNKEEISEIKNTRNEKSESFEDLKKIICQK